MKKCPQCGTQYSDVTLSFCLQDGTPLIAAPATDTSTVVLGETETLAARRDAVRVPVGDSTAGTWGQSEVTHVAAPPPEKKGSKMALAIVLTIFGMLILFGIIGAAAIVFFRNSQQASVQNVSTLPNTNLGGLNTNYNSYSTAYPTASPMGNSKPSTTPAKTPPPPPPAPSSYPSTTRLKFARGSYSTSFAGDLNPGDTRSLVLACRSGQSLSANVTSGSSCVTLRGGGTSLRTTTSSGDNYVTLTNNCSSVVHFSVSISIV